MIKETITSSEQFSNLATISSFDPRTQSITFKTEKIHPLEMKPQTTPVLLLFSNPHPLSVAAGMFLSEPRSRSFWVRLFDCACMQPSEPLKHAISNWDDETIGLLTQNLLYQTFSDKISIYMDCLESLPTNQYNDLKKIFPGEEGRELRSTALQIPGAAALADLSAKNNIQSWIVYSAEAFRYICDEKSLGNNAPDRIVEALNKYYAEQDDRSFWSELSDLKRKVVINGLEIDVNLALIARRKNWKNKSGEYYFTAMLDGILSQILKQGGYLPLK